MKESKNNPSLGVNIDHVATIRQTRGTVYPIPLETANLAIKGGADQITIHLREDRRHIQDKDLFDLRENISVPLNLEMAAIDEIVEIAIQAKPNVATIVPEKRNEVTTEGGLDCITNRNTLKRVIGSLHDGGIEVSLFVDPEISQIEMAKELGADAVELHTGKYCELFLKAGREQELKKMKEAAKLAKKLRLRVCAGHGLNYDNTAYVVENIAEITEYNIGHSIVAKAIMIGIEAAVKEMVDIIKR